MKIAAFWFFIATIFALYVFGSNEYSEKEEIAAICSLVFLIPGLISIAGIYILRKYKKLVTPANSATLEN